MNTNVLVIADTLVQLYVLYCELRVRYGGCGHREGVGGGRVCVQYHGTRAQRSACDRKFSSISQSASSGAKQLQLSNAALRPPNPSNHTKQSSLGWERMIAYKSVLSVVVSVK